MRQTCADALALASRLVTYPGDGYSDDVNALARVLADSDPDAARDLADFAARITAHSITERAGAERGARDPAPRQARGALSQSKSASEGAWRGAGVPAIASIEAQRELFTQTFDLNPVCALEVGWHLFGEEYERGAFLVRMRQALREHGIDEAGELPDHLASMLLLVSRIDAHDAEVLIATALVPAVDKMLDPLEKSESPFLPLVKVIRQVLAACVPLGNSHGLRHSNEEATHA